MSITNMDTLVAGLIKGTRPSIYKATIASLTAGTIASLWRATGIPAQGAIPSTFAVCDNTLLGCIPLPSLSIGENLYLGKIHISCSIANSFLLLDRLAHMGGLNGTLTTAQTVGVNISTPASNGRCQADGSDVEWFLEWYTATGATAVTATITYVDQTDTTRTCTVSLTATRPAGCMLPIIPNAGQSIKSITSVQLSATTGTAGNFGVTACKKLTNYAVMIANIGQNYDFADLGLPEIKQSSCLMIAVICTSTSTGVVIGSVGYAQG